VRVWDDALNIGDRVLVYCAVAGALLMKPSYDNIQLAAVLLPCARCGARYYVTVPREGWICRACADNTGKLDNNTGNVHNGVWRLRHHE